MNTAHPPYSLFMTSIVITHAHASPYAHVCTLFDLYYKFLISFLVIISYSYLSAGTVAGRLIILGYSLYPGLSCLCEPLVVLVDQGLREEVWTVSRLGLCHRRFGCGRETVVDVVGLVLVEVSVSCDRFPALFFFSLIVPFCFLLSICFFPAASELIRPFSV